MSKLLGRMVRKHDKNLRDSRRIRGTTPEIEEAARKLRNNLTPAEARLWEALRISD